MAGSGLLVAASGLLVPVVVGPLVVGGSGLLVAVRVYVCWWLESVGQCCAVVCLWHIVVHWWVGMVC